MLVEVFGVYPQVKVVDLLLTHQNIEYTKEEIAECAEISIDTLYNFWGAIRKIRDRKTNQKSGGNTIIHGKYGLCGDEGT